MNVHLVFIKIRIDHNFAVYFIKDPIIRRSMIGRENRYPGKERFSVRDTSSANKSLKGLAAEGDESSWRRRLKRE